MPTLAGWYRIKLAGADGAVCSLLSAQFLQILGPRRLVSDRRAFFNEWNLVRKFDFYPVSIYQTIGMSRRVERYIFQVVRRDQLIERGRRATGGLPVLSDDRFDRRHFICYLQGSQMGQRVAANLFVLCALVGRGPHQRAPSAYRRRVAPSAPP